MSTVRSRTRLTVNEQLLVVAELSKSDCQGVHLEAERQTLTGFVYRERLITLPNSAPGGNLIGRSHINVTVVGLVGIDQLVGETAPGGVGIRVGWCPGDAVDHRVEIGVVGGRERRLRKKCVDVPVLWWSAVARRLRADRQVVDSIVVTRGRSADGAEVRGGGSEIAA